MILLGTSGLLPYRCTISAWISPLSSTEKRTVTLFPPLVSAPEKLRFAICFAV